jgi:ABC-type multidrug transport system permease subunit
MIYDVLTVCWRDWLVLKRRLGRFIFARMISPILYLVAFGWGLGSQMQVYEGRYIDFVVPGILALNSMLLSFNAVGSPLNMSRLYHKTLEEYLIAPISYTSFVFGKILSGMLRGLISSSVIILLAYLFGAHFKVGLAFWVVLVLNCVLFAALGFVAAMYMGSHEEMANFNTYVLTPMSFLCGTFFTADRLPVLMQYILTILPLTHTSHALRYAAGSGELLWGSVGVMTLYAAIFIGLSIVKMRQCKE